MTNKWSLYEFLKKRYMASGMVADPDEARAEFPEMPLEEMGEGYTEFYLVVGRFEKGA